MASSSIPDVSVGSLKLDGVRPLFILGPCVIESEEFAWQMARELKQICTAGDHAFVFKGSYDKANRTSVDSFRGPGIKDGCRILSEIGKELGVPVLTDVHSVEDVEHAAECIDVLQIPAFLCRQTDLIIAAGRSGRVVNVKKGQFLAPWDIGNIGDKLRHVGCENFFFTERGASFGYNNLVADMRSLCWIREQGFRVVFDATHSVQRPGGQGKSSGGDGALAPVLAQAAVATGCCDGIFMETHMDPSKALSDGPNQVPLAQMPSVLNRLTRIFNATHEIDR